MEELEELGETFVKGEKLSGSGNDKDGNGDGTV